MRGIREVAEIGQEMCHWLPVFGQPVLFDRQTRERSPCVEDDSDAWDENGRATELSSLMFVVFVRVRGDGCDSLKLNQDMSFG